jgi:endo-beta-N-acetylglucosaminidase D
MKHIWPAIACMLAAGAVAQGLPGQPYCSYWYPDDLLTWTPSSDLDAPYNKGSVPLAGRFTGDIQVNAHARPGEASIAALCAWFSTSANPSQGLDDFDIFAPNYWMYIDIMVFWGGSAGEGLILAPSPYVIDAAHRNGVPVYGTIFFPPTVYGGQIQWVWDLVQREGSSFPVADKLIEVAEYYGFEGWFVNQETAGGNAELAMQVRDFMDYIQTTSDIDVMWYDAMIENGAISWQNALNSNNDMFFHDGEIISDEFFINFGWNSTGLTNSGNLAQSLGRSKYELFAGVDVEANGYGTSVNWDAVFPEGQPHRTSLGFYRPEWCFNSSSGPVDFYQRENRFWVGANRDPSNTATSEAWKGMAHYVVDKSPINALPFVTNFNTGQGTLYSIDGAVRRSGEWANPSLQDVLPTWRWIADCPGTPLYPDLVWDDAYYGGTCLEVTGDIAPGSPTTLQLYKTDLSLSSSSIAQLAFRTSSAGSPSHMELALDFTDTSGMSEYISAGSSSGAGWELETLPLGQFAGRTLEAVGLRFSSGSALTGYEIRVGRIALLDGMPQAPQPPSGLWVEGFYQIDDDNGTVRLRWTASPDDGVREYNVYRLNADDSRTFLGATPGSAYFVPAVQRAEGEDETTLLVESVGEDFALSSAVSTTITWTITGIGGTSPGGRAAMEQPSPNPASSSAAIRYCLPSSGPARIDIFSLDGRIVATPGSGLQEAGWHVCEWDCAGMPGGIYFARLAFPGGTLVRKLTVMR